ncbi:MAG: GNAT family N-acetyltransferase [Syntrophobacteraceae bacterium]|jgi:acyl-CoA hydrolase/GNAT superfamily N-acetyltransferase
MGQQSFYTKKIVSADEAISKIKIGNRVFVGSACGEPQYLIKKMVVNQDLHDIMIYQMFSGTLARYVNDESFLKRFSLKLFLISIAMRRAAFEGKIDYIPIYISRIPELFASKSIGINVALIQVSPPDEFGYCSLGISVDVTKSAIANAGLVIAQVNSKMPRTMGDTFVHVDTIDYMVEFDEPLLRWLPEFKDPDIARRIGLYVSQLVDDGATLQIGFGALPHAILQYLDKKKDLGVHTQLITDSFIPLIEKKVITNKKKTLLPGRIVASMVMGSEKIYEYVHNNPMFYFRTSEFVSNPTVIAQNDRMISISSALEIDLTGQVCTDSLGYLFYGGIGDQVDFLHGSAMSKGGFSIIAFPSTAQNGRVSRIVSHLSEGAGVATTRGDINYVVTEYGIAHLSGKSIYQRVMELAQIAHPKFREHLIEMAKKRHYIFADQLPPSIDDLLFLEEYKSTMELKNGSNISFRPLLPSDEFAYRNFFYSLKDETIYFRFFYRMKLFTHEVVQDQWASLDYRNNLSIIGLELSGGHEQIVAVGSYARGDDPKDAEVAFVIHEEFQGMGIASNLLQVLEKIAMANGFKKFLASVLKENGAMVRVFKKRYPNAKVTLSSENDYRICMDFYDSMENVEDELR